MTSPKNQFWVFVLLCAVGCCCFISYNLVRMPALAPFAESLGAGPLAVGWVVAASTLTGVFLKLPVGALSDVLGRFRLMTVGVLAFALPPFAYPFVTDVAQLVGLRIVHGLATAVFTPLVLAMVASMYAHKRGEALGWYTSAAQGGALLGPMLGGLLVDTVGFSRTFETAGLFGLVTLGLFFLSSRLAGRTEYRPRETQEVFRKLRLGLTRVIQHTQMVATSCAEAVKMMANGTLMAFLPLYALSVGLTITDGGFLFGIQGLTSFVSKPIMGRVSDRVGRRPLIALGLVLCSVTIVGIPQVSTFPFLLLLAAGFGLGEAIVTSSTAAFIADLSDENSLGAGMGLRGTIMDIGHASGPIIAGVLVVSISYTGSFMVIGGILFGGAVLFLWATMPKR